MAAPQAELSEAEREAGRILFARHWGFARGCARVEDLPSADITEVALAGRSNVGKSTLINALSAQNALARTSNAPGRTRQINFFESAGVALRLADLPGYGFARAPKREIAQWTGLIDAYLRGRANLRRVFVLIDARHGLKPGDEAVLDELDAAAVGYQIVLTKADKPSTAELDRAIAATRRAIGKRPAAHPDIVVTSARNGTGIEGLRAVIARLV